MTAWRKVEDGKVSRIIETGADGAPGSGFEKIPADYDYVVGTPLAWIDETGRRIPDHVLVEKGARKDFLGIWYSMENPGETKIITVLDEEPGESFTKERPIENEPYQKWDAKKKCWVVDVEKKEAAEKENKIAETQSAIDEAERKIQRSLRAKLAGNATSEDERYFAALSTEIGQLRTKKHELLSA